MPGETPYECWYGEACQVARRHSHPYVVARYGARRCQCGHRHFEVSCSQLGDPEVVCAKCKRTNYSATAYEVGCLTGRHRGPLEDQLPSALPRATPF